MHRKVGYTYLPILLVSRRNASKSVKVVILNDLTHI